MAAQRQKIAAGDYWVVIHLDISEGIDVRSPLPAHPNVYNQRLQGASVAEEITQLLVKWQDGDRSALEELMPIIYDELRKLGRAHIRRRPEASLLQPTALVHEAWLRLASGHEAPFQCRGEFFALASRVMRGILADQVRRQRAAKRGGSQIEVPLQDAIAGEQTRVLDFLVLDDALTRLSGIKLRYTHIIEMRFFGGLTMPQIAGALGISTATVEREWSFARLWLIRELAPSHESESAS